MPIAVTLPSVTDAPTKTIVGQACQFSFLKTGGTQKNYRGKISLEYSEPEKVERKTPVVGGGGALEVSRTVIIGRTLSGKLTLDTFGTDDVIFLNEVSQSGTGRFWIRDPDDAVNTVALLSNEFNCVVFGSGTLAFDQTTFAEFTVNIAINGTFTLTPDGSTSV